MADRIFRATSAMLLGLAGPATAFASAVAPSSERIVCSVAAAQHYGLPANVMLAVAEQEGGKPGQWVRNTNGTFDLGAMQLNTSYMRTLARYGIRPEHVTSAGCYPYQLAAWRIRRHVQYDRGDFWTRVSNYHSYTPVHNARYRAGIIKRAYKWHLWLTARGVRAA